VNYIPLDVSLEDVKAEFEKAGPIISIKLETREKNI
jgi:hypothetical protein